MHGSMTNNKYKVSTEIDLNNPVTRYDLIERYFRNHPERSGGVNLSYRRDVHDAKINAMENDMLRRLAEGGFL